MAAPSDVRRLAILVVDDNHDAADTLVLFIRMCGHDARAAYCGKQALTMVDDWQPDAAILDVVMKGIDGIELAARLRQGAIGGLLIVALTGLGTTDEVARLRDGPFDFLFLKPIDPDEMLRVLSDHVSAQFGPSLTPPRLQRNSPK
jgi:CheY-like chemotaxis protein